MRKRHAVRSTNAGELEFMHIALTQSINDEINRETTIADDDIRDGRLSLIHFGRAVRTVQAICKTPHGKCLGDRGARIDRLGQLQTESVGADPHRFNGKYGPSFILDALDTITARAKGGPAAIGHTDQQHRGPILFRPGQSGDAARETGQERIAGSLPMTIDLLEINPHHDRGVLITDIRLAGKWTECSAGRVPDEA